MTGWLVCAMIMGASPSVPLSTRSASPDGLRRLGFEPSRIQALRERMQGFVSSGELTGCVGLVWRHGKLVTWDAVGYLDVSQTKPMAFDTVFQAMSMTKPLAAAAVCLLVERGLVRLNDPVQRYLPAFDRRIRVRHLLDHTSGIPSDMPVSDEERAKWTLAEFVDLVAKQPLLTEPGTAERYSGPAISTAGRIVEIVSGKSFEQFLRKELFEPLKMRSSWMFLPPAERARLAEVPALESGRLVPTSDDPARPGARFANPAGGLYSTAADLARWHQAMLDGGKPVLSKATVDRMVRLPDTRPAGAGEEFGFGLGWSVARKRTSGLLPAGTFGHSGAFGTYGWADSSTGIVGVFLAQRLYGAEREIDVFRTMVYAALR